MGDWTFEQMYRDFWSRPLLTPVLKTYSAFMNIKRYDRMPFYFAPAAGKVVNYEDKLINLMDWMVDAHEEARNKEDRNKNFYMRSVYCFYNFHRYQNDTVANMMYDVKASRPAYDKINSTVDQQNRVFYATAAIFHSASFMYLSYFFRYRRITLAPAVALGAAYYVFFENANNIMYKLIVDRAVIRDARRLGYSAQVQPVGQAKNRGLDFI